MAIAALHSASSGLSALSTSIDVIANNLANSNNAGFKASRANFEDLLYEEKMQPGVENENGDQRPAGLYVGLGTRVSNTQIDFKTGSPQTTDRKLDVMVDGNGFFQVNITRGQETTAFTRSGNFFMNSEGDLVLGNSNGPRLEPNINIPADAEDVTISNDGRVLVSLPGEAELQEVGQMEVANFINPHGLKQIGGNLYLESSASGPPTVGNPNTDNFGALLQGSLEASNVDPVVELVELIKAQRAFEMNSQSIQAADSTLEVISNLRRF
ncbi:MAG TPA: flagellar basal-body rod protein FlgG [Phycisphaerales bacterium]|nr:flagellar basal-body rod protein FlgG [Phycisphaerales bacterium]HCD33583.1 flagellar basal-body rod protein FlgG [Phycisphaerales bacterium]|tara:strand:+ start:48976 stop:49782 length:807 start_codon:yes stop_codon:yes gene_type:complete